MAQHETTRGCKRDKGQQGLTERVTLRVRKNKRGREVPLDSVSSPVKSSLISLCSRQDRSMQACLLHMYGLRTCVTFLRFTRPGQKPPGLMLCLTTALVHPSHFTTQRQLFREKLQVQSCEQLLHPQASGSQGQTFFLLKPVPVLDLTALTSGLYLLNLCLWSLD